MHLNQQQCTNCVRCDSVEFGSASFGLNETSSDYKTHAQIYISNKLKSIFYLLVIQLIINTWKRPREKENQALFFETNSKEKKIEMLLWDTQN